MTKFFHFKTLCLCFFVVNMFPEGELKAQANDNSDVIGSVQSQVVKAYPIAIPEVSADKKYSKAQRFSVGLTAVIRRNFSHTAIFKLVAPSSYLLKTQLPNEAVKYDAWLQVGADAFTYIYVKEISGEFLIDVNLLGSAALKKIFSKSYKGTSKNLRKIAHQISDDIYFQLSGQKGFFSTKIAAVKLINGQKQIVILDADGQRERQMTRSGQLNILPSWSPDAQKLLFTSYRRGNPDLYRLNINGGSSTLISSREGLNAGGQYSPNGQQIVLTLSKDGNSELYALNSKGKLLKRLTNSWGTDTSGRFSPDGKKIAFVSSRRKYPHIFIMPVIGGPAKRLTFQGNYSQTPVYHPNGEYIVYTARDEKNRLDLFSIEINTGEIKRITQNQGNNESPSFSPNGNLIVFVSDRTGSRQLWISSFDGEFQKQLTSQGRYDSPSWSPFGRK